MEKILIVDDMQQNLELMSNYLQNTGYEVYSAQSGKAAISKAKLLNPSLIILDLIMPEISGFDICKTLKSNPDTASILILVVTALDSRESKKRAFELGADDFLPKPFDRSTLHARIKALLRVKTLSDELKNQYAKLKEKNEQLELQMKMARQIQQAMIQEYHMECDKLTVNSRYMPALDIGGDMYDVVKAGGDNVGIFIADVSGHGISAALLTSMLKVMFQTNSHLHTDPGSLLLELNREFSAVFNTDASVYACAFYAYIDTEERTITYSNAGHAFPIFLDAKNTAAGELNMGGIPLGLMDDAEYENKKFSYRGGDMVLFHTDGLCDFYYKDNPEEFLYLLKRLLCDMKEGFPADSILNEILERFYNPDDSKFENDDISIILCCMK